MTSLPQLGTAATEKLGVHFVSTRVLAAPENDGLGFIVRGQLEADVGIDGHIEIRDRATSMTT